MTHRDRPEIVTDRVVLRDWRSDEAAALEAVFGADTVREIPMAALDRAAAVRLLDRYADHASARPRTIYDLAIVDAGSPDEPPCGALTLSHESPEHGRCEVGFALAPAARGRGLATGAVAAAIDFAFAEVGAHRVWAVCTPENRRSAAVMARSGMTHEGTLQHDLCIDGTWRDSEMWAVLAPNVR